MRGTLVVLDVATGAETVVAEGPGHATDPAWSPDGRRLAFASTRDDFGDSCFRDCVPNGEIYVMNADGGCPRRVADLDGWERSPVWQPTAAPTGAPLRC